ncbi:MAG: hypothetical protein N4A74_21585 [Carboxylicivirga sp.]|nr:hypothetical protein [Carboxylicivirga sp.]
MSIISLLGVLATGIWGGIKDHKRRKGQGGTRQSFRPEPFDKRLEDKY